MKHYALSVRQCQISHRWAFPSSGWLEWCSPLTEDLDSTEESWSSVKLSGLASPSSRLPQLELGLSISWRRSSRARVASWTARAAGASPSTMSSWSLRSLARKLMYFMARRRISFLLSFLSGGWVGMSFRRSAKAPFTFCCRQRSRVFVKIRRTTLGCEPAKQRKYSQVILVRNGLGCWNRHFF